jgi:hypothetical protein
VAGFDHLVPEAKLEKAEHGLVPKTDGWYILGLRGAEWRHADGRGAVASCSTTSKASKSPPARD